MSRIATEEYISNLGGGVATSPTKCITKEMIVSNYPSVQIVGDYKDNQLVKEESLSVTSDRLVFNNTFLLTTDTTGWTKLGEVNTTISPTNGLICNNTFLGYANNKNLKWNSFNEIEFELDLNMQNINTTAYKTIVALAPNHHPDSTRLLYQENNSMALVLRDNTPNPGWISLYTSEYDWGQFNTWFHVKVYFNISERTMSLTANDYTKSAIHGWSAFPNFNTLLFGALDSNLNQRAGCMIKNFKLRAN